MVNLVAAVESGVMMIIGVILSGKDVGKTRKAIGKIVFQRKRNQIVIALGMINLETNVTFGVTIRLGVILKIKKTAEKTKMQIGKAAKRKIHAHAKVDHRQETPVQNGDIQINGAIL